MSVCIAEDSVEVESEIFCFYAVYNANGHLKPLLHYAFLACVFDENARDFVLGILGILRKYFPNQ